jgi:hypothetical protein
VAKDLAPNLTLQLAYLGVQGEAIAFFDHKSQNKIVFGSDLKLSRRSRTV